MNETKAIKCVKCQELTWDDDFHKLNGKPYCTICMKEVLLEQVKKQKEVIDRIKEYINPLITNRDDEHCYAINWYNKDVLLSILKEVSE